MVQRYYNFLETNIFFKKMCILFLKFCVFLLQKDDFIYKITHLDLFSIPCAAQY